MLLGLRNWYLSKSGRCHCFGLTDTLANAFDSHHPPATAYRIANKEHGVFLEGYNAQKASFARTINVKQIGHAVYSIPAFNETYLITLPNLHIEGLIFGAPFVELNDKTYITSSSGYTCKVDYSGKGWLSGKKNSFTATMYPTGKEKDILYTATGQWNKTFEICEGSDRKHNAIDSYDSEAIPPTPLTIAPLEQQDPMESRRAWSQVAKGIANGDMDFTGIEKTKIEESQRALRKQEAAEGRTWERRYFTKVESDPVLNQLGPVIGLLPDADKTGGIWRFDEAKANKLQTASANTSAPAPSSTSSHAPVPSSTPFASSAPVSESGPATSSVPTTGSVSVAEFMSAK